MKVPVSVPCRGGTVGSWVKRWQLKGSRKDHVGQILHFPFGFCNPKFKIFVFKHMVLPEIQALPPFSI